jgi:hypothetical protein
MHHVVRFAGLGLIVPWWQTRWSMPASAPGNQSATDNEVSARTVP